MLYALLIYQAEETLAAMDQEELDTMLAQHGVVHSTTKGDGTFRAADKLAHSSVATTLKTRAGDTEVFDGPYAETKEQLVGFYLVDCANLDEAIDKAKLIPQGEMGGVEIRPISFHEDLSGVQRTDD